VLSVAFSLSVQSGQETVALASLFEVPVLNDPASEVVLDAPVFDDPDDDFGVHSGQRVLDALLVLEARSLRVAGRLESLKILDELLPALVLNVSVEKSEFCVVRDLVELGGT